MTKDQKKSHTIPDLVIFIGRCWTKKYERLANQITAHVESKYNNRVKVISRIKKTSQTIQSLSIGMLFLSCILFLILMFSQPILDLIGFSYIQDYIEPYKLHIYFTALFSFFGSRLITVSKVFKVYVNNQIVYCKERRDRLESLDKITTALDYYIKRNVENAESYLKK